MISTTGVRVAAMPPQQAAAVLSICRLGIDEQNATFGTTAPAQLYCPVTALATRFVVVAVG